MCRPRLASSDRGNTPRRIRRPPKQSHRFPFSRLTIGKSGNRHPG
jgi:hypothetical protein